MRATPVRVITIQFSRIPLLYQSVPEGPRLVFSVVPRAAAVALRVARRAGFRVAFAPVEPRLGSVAEFPARRYSLVSPLNDVPFAGSDFQSKSSRSEISDFSSIPSKRFRRGLFCCLIPIKPSSLSCANSNAASSSPTVASVARISRTVWSCMPGNRRTTSSRVAVAIVERYHCWSSLRYQGLYTSEFRRSSSISITPTSTPAMHGA